MAKKIEEAFNDCFERLMSGESLDSCVNSYPEFAEELDVMLRTVFDVKRKAYPVQPSPEFKYWSRVRLQGVQSYLDRQPAPSQPFFSGLRANLAIALASFLVIIIVSSSTAFASSTALPDQPLYGIKLAVEQSQLALTTSDSKKAELYARLVEKRAEEIAAMANQGKSDKVDSTTAIMNYQLDQAATFLQRYETSVAEVQASTLPAAATTTTVPVPPPPPQETTSTTTATQPAASSVTAPTTTTGTTTATGTSTSGQTSGTTGTTSTTGAATGGASGQSTTTTGKSTTGTTSTDNKTGQKQPQQPVVSAQRLAELNKIKANINASTSKSVTVLQNALDKAPDNARAGLSNALDRAKLANQKFLLQQQQQLQLQQQPNTTNKGTTDTQNTK